MGVRIRPLESVETNSSFQGIFRNESGFYEKHNGACGKSVNSRYNQRLHSPDVGVPDVRFLFDDRTRLLTAAVLSETNLCRRHL